MNEKQKVLFAITAIYLQQKGKCQSIWVHKTIQVQSQHGEYYHMYTETYYKL